MNKFREQSPSIVLFTGNAKLLKYTLGSQPHEASAVLVSKPRCVEVKWLLRSVPHEGINSHFGCRHMNTACLENGLKSGIFWLTWQPHSTSADCAKELFKPLKDSASLQWKQIFGFEFPAFCEWRHKWGSFLAILAHVVSSRALSLDRSILLKFSLDTSHPKYRKTWILV